MREEEIMKKIFSLCVHASAVSISMDFMRNESVLIVKLHYGLVTTDQMEEDRKLLVEELKEFVPDGIELEIRS